MVQERMYRAEIGKTIKLDMHKENIIHQLLGGDMYTTKIKLIIVRALI